MPFDTMQVELQTLLNDCQTWLSAVERSGKVDAYQQQYESISDLLSFCQEQLHLVPNHEEQLEELYQKLKVLLLFPKYKLTLQKEKLASYKKVAQLKACQDFLDGVLTINPVDCEQYRQLWKIHRRSLQKPHESKHYHLFYAIRHYPIAVQVAHQFNQGYQLYLKLKNAIASIKQESLRLNVQFNSYKLTINTPVQQPALEALAQQIREYRAVIRHVPKDLQKEFKPATKIIQEIDHNLQNTLARTVTRLTNPEEQPTGIPSSCQLKIVEGPLFATPLHPTTELNPIAGNDPQQGYLGDCFLIASLIALADKHPNVIRNAIRESKRGDKTIYTVTLFIAQNPNNERLQATTVVVDNQFVVNQHHSLEFAPRGDQKELWVLVLEKAIAKVIGGYQELDDGGIAQNIIAMLTGILPERKNLNYFDSTVELANYLQSNAAKLLTISTKSVDADFPKGYRLRRSDGLFSERDTLKLSSKDIIYCDHVYYIKDIDVKKDAITLQNPHEYDSKQPTAKYPAVTLQELLDCFHKITIEK